MADYIFTQNGDNNVQIGDMTGMPYHVETALKWALEHNFQSVAAQYSKTLALEIVRLREDNERMYAALELAQRRAAAYEDTGLTPDEIAALRAELDAFKADIEAGRLVRLPYPIGTNAYVLEREGPLSGRVMPIKVCGYSESDWHGSRNAGKDRHFVICHNSYNKPYAKQLWDVFLTEEAARAALTQHDSAQDGREGAEHD